MDTNFILDFLKQVGTGTFALLAITNPFGNLPIFLSMSEDLNNELRKRLFRIVVLTGIIIMIIFAVIGTFIMEKFFQVDLAALRIAGGSLLIAMGIKNLLFQEAKEHEETKVLDSDDAVNSRIIPMAFPLLVGPGALATIIVIDSESGKLVAFLSIFISFAVIFLLFMRSGVIERLLGKLSLYVLSRIMQVFIMAIGAKMLVMGVLDAFPVLKG